MQVQLKDPSVSTPMSRSTRIANDTATRNPSRLTSQPRRPDAPCAKPHATSRSHSFPYRGAKNASTGPTTAYCRGFVAVSGRPAGPSRLSIVQGTISCPLWYGRPGSRMFRLADHTEAAQRLVVVVRQALATM